MIKISACLIVKNEEENIRRCLDSIKDKVDEIVITDTGSTDKTREILAEYAINYNMKLFYDEWKNDFSYHRNETIKHASGDWILSIDADEELIVETDLAMMLKNVPEDINACRCTLHDMEKGKKILEFDIDRIFRKGHIKYEGIVHNQTNWGDNRVCFLQGVVLKHYGYDIPHEKKQAKFNRTTSLLLETIKESPGNFDAYRYLGASHSFIGKSEQAIFYLDTYISNAKNRSTFNRSAWFELAIEYYNLENYIKCNDTIMEGLEFDPENIDLHFLKLQLSNKIQDIGGSVLAAQKYVELYDRYKVDTSLRQNRFIYMLSEEALLMACDVLIFYYKQYIDKLESRVESLKKGD